ncbi:DMT family transporter [bacterium]|nr:DMT family transporter [bacterium]
MSDRILSTSEGTNQSVFTMFDWMLFVSISVISGSSFLLTAIGLDAFEPGLTTWLRVGSGAAVLWAIPAARVRIEPADRPRVMALSLLWVAIPFTLLPIAQQWINSAIAGMLNGAMPMFTALVATLMLRRRPRGALVLGLAIGFIGVITISAPSIGESETQTLGVTLVVLATVGYGIAINIAAPLQQRYGALPVMAPMLGLATIWTAPFGLVGIAGSSFAWDSALAVLAAGVLGTGLAFVIMSSLAGRVGATRASFITYVVPVVALTVGVVFRGDEVQLIAIVGVVLVIVGAFLASRREVAASAESAGSVPA